MIFSEPVAGAFTITPPANWSWRQAHGVLHSDGRTVNIEYGPPACKPNAWRPPACYVNGSINARCDLITVAVGAPGHGTFRRAASRSTARYYCPDNASDPRTHYGLTVVRDFFYTFSMAPDLIPPTDIANTLDYFLSGENLSTGSVSEGGNPPHPPINYVDCWDEGPFLALSAGKYARLFGDTEWLCGQHPAGGARLQRLRRALEFLKISRQPGQPHLVTAPTPHCM